MQLEEGPAPLFLRIGKAVTDAIKRGREIAFTTGRGAGGPGLYVARGRALRDTDDDDSE
jgi:hypothetical protein